MDKTCYDLLLFYKACLVSPGQCVAQHLHAVFSHFKVRGRNDINNVYISVIYRQVIGKWIRPLAILPNSVPFNLMLLKFSVVAFSILIVTLLSTNDCDFLHPVNSNSKEIKTTKSFNIIFYFPDTRAQQIVARRRYTWK